MSNYTMVEFLKKMEPRVRRDEALISRCIEDLRRQYDTLWDAANGILQGLARIQ